MRTKLYVLAPLLALALFIGVFSVWKQHDDKVRAERAATERAELIAKREAEEAARKAAFAEAIAAREQRQAERAEREARRKADEAARLQALDQRDALALEVGTSKRRLQELTTAIENERDAVATLEITAKALATEKESLAQLAAKATANQAAITKLLSAPAVTQQP